MFNNLGKTEKPATAFGTATDSGSLPGAGPTVNKGIPSSKKPFYANGLRFSCIRCSGCCRHESGFVFLSEKDVSLLGTALNLQAGEFIRTYCRWVPSGNNTWQLSLREKSNLDCVFWKDGCSVYEKRPLQCRAFPFWHSVINSGTSWEATARDCPGIGKGVLHSPESIEYWLALRGKEPIITKGES